MEDFKNLIIKDVFIVVVNLTRATIKEADRLKRILDKDIENHIRKIVIDLSTCEFMDSTFIGVLVVALKKIAKISGELHIVRPASIAETVLVKSGTMNIFNVYNTIEEAVESFQSPIVTDNNSKANYFYQ